MAIKYSIIEKIGLTGYRKGEPVAGRLQADFTKQIFAKKMKFYF